MKKNFKLVAVLLSVSLMLSSCIGSFNLTNKVKAWNEGLGDKFVNELVFIALHVVPVYEIAIFIDAVVLNSVEFWTGDKLVAEPGETKVVTVELGPEAFRFFDEASMSWKTESGEFEILACSSSDKIRKSAKVVL
jgi:hypothetical protein